MAKVGMFVSGRRLIWMLVLMLLMHGWTGLTAASQIGTALIPPQDDVYEFLNNCADLGLIPLGAVTVKPLSRAAVAEYLLDITCQNPFGTQPVRQADLEFYLREFAAEGRALLATAEGDGGPVRVMRTAGSVSLQELNRPHRHLLSRGYDGFNFILDPILLVRSDFSAKKAVFRRAAGLQFRGGFNGRLGFYFRFVDHVERGNSPYDTRDDLLNDHFGYVGPLQGGRETYYDLSEAHLHLARDSWELFFGKERPAWGSGRMDGLELTSAAPSFNQLRFIIKPVPSVRFIYLLGQLHPWKTPVDVLYETPEGWTRSLLAPKWLAAHRLEYAPLDWITIGVGESIVWGERALDAAYVLPLNFYYSAEHDGGDQDNALMWGDIILRVAPGMVFYGEILIDDLKTSTLGEGDPGNKVALLAGAGWLPVWWEKMRFCLEYSRLEPFVYSHFYPVNRYSQWTTGLGSELLPNSDRLGLQVKYQPVRAVKMAGTIAWNRHGSAGGDIYTAVPHTPSRVYFLSGVRTDWLQWSGNIAWEPIAGAEIRVGTIRGERNALMPDRYYLELEYRY